MNNTNKETILRLLRMLGLDPGLTNTGFAVADVDMDQRKIKRVIDLGLLKTERNILLSVRRTSDDLRRAQEIYQALHRIASDLKVDVIAVEMVTTTPYRRPNISFGVMIGVVAGLQLPVFEVLPYEAKAAAVGKRDATKKDMVHWALKTCGEHVTWPTSAKSNKWGLMHDGSFVTLQAEHQADALAMIHGALHTEQFRLSAALFANASVRRRRVRNRLA
ncbi:MAG: hypothetical protein EOO38_13390 [Cytophagaceae bacterium]|nr:MAG: hypothetical protein EOO38_13390 [Cytophagaceae bacterium]